MRTQPFIPATLALVSLALFAACGEDPASPATAPDASLVADAGSPASPDAGPIASPDAGPTSSPDSGPTSSPDAGSVPGDDAGAPIVDAGETASDAGTPPSDDAGSTGAPVEVHAALELEGAVTATITEELGGFLITTAADGTRYTLHLPPHAVDHDTIVTLTPVANVPDLPFAGGLVAGADLAPDGLRLLVAGELLIRPATPVAAPEDAISIAWHGSGTAMHLYPLATDSLDLRLPLVHFSGYAIVNATPNEVTTQRMTPAGSPEDTLEQNLQEHATSLRQAAAASADPEQLYLRYLEDLRDYFETHLRPLLQAPIASCDGGAAIARDLLGWERRAALVGLDDELQAEVDAADALGYLTRVEATCWDEAIGDCLDLGDVEQRSRVLGVLRTVALLGLTDPTRFDLETAPACVWHGSISWTSSVHLAPAGTTATTDLSYDASLNVRATLETTLSSDGRVATTELTTDANGNLSTMSASRSDQSVTEGSCPIIHVTDFTSSATGSNTTSIDVSLVRSTTTYLLMATFPAVMATGMHETHDVLTDTCVPANDFDVTDTAPYQYGVPYLALNAVGNLSRGQRTIAGSTVMGGDVYFGQQSTGTLSWSLTKSAH